MWLITYFIPALTCLVTATISQSDWGNFTNPIIWEDLPDNEVSRLGDAYYMSASSFHFSPGAPILRSYDLVNWEFIGHSVPTLHFGPAYDMAGGRTAYVGGIWASSLRHREFDNHWYFIACVDFINTHIYRTENILGPWEHHATIEKCYYDAGFLFDEDDGSVYVAHGNTEIEVSQLSEDVTAEIRTDIVFTTPEDIASLEGARMYKRDGIFYIFLTRPPDAQYILKSNSPWGPYDIEVLCDRITLTAIPEAGAPHQGSLVDTPDGNWYYMGFVDIYPGGRAPVLAPIDWKDNGFPSLVTIDGEWGDYPYPLPRVDVPDVMGLDQFFGTVLQPHWEWNHNPDVAGFDVNDGLTLRTVTVTHDLYLARNTLTRRIRGPIGVGTLHIDFSDMADGDRAGLAVLRQDSGIIGVERDGDEYSIVVHSLAMSENFNATKQVVELARENISFRQVYLRAEVDVRPNANNRANFSYSADGADFTDLGTFELNRSWMFFPGYRYGVYNHASRNLGGSVRVLSFFNA